MAILTDSIVDVGTYTTFNIGLSKAISNYSADDIWNFPYCSSQWEYFKHIGHFDETMWDFAPGGTGEGTNKLFPLKYVGRNAQYYPQTYNFDPGEIEYNTPAGIYCRVIWLYGTDTQISNLLTGKRRSIYATDGFKIVTQMDMTKVFLFLDNFKAMPYGNNVNVNNINTLNYDNFKIKEEHDDVTDYTHPRNCSIFPVVMFKYNDKLFLHLLFQRLYESLDWSWGVHSALNETRDKIQGYEWGAQPCSYDGTSGCFWAVNIGRDFVGLRPQNVESFHTATDIPDIGAMYQWHYSYQTGGRLNPVTEQAYLKLASWYGGMFYHNGKYYKPIIEDGYVTGYTDDMTVPSDIDNWTGATNHDVPPAPPGGGGDDDDPSDDQASGGIYGGAQGMCNLYYMTAGEIKDLQNWFRGSVFSPGIQIPADFDPSNQLIGLMAFPIELGGSVDSTTITFRTADNQSVDTGVSCQKAYGDDLKFDMGTIDIPARMQERGVPFLDYSSQVEVYIPFCDVVQLDVQQVIGTTLTCEMWISPSTGDVSAMLSSGTHPVAYTSGNCAQQLPISVSSYGAIAGAKLAAQNRNTQAVFQAAQNVVKDITNTGAIGSAISNHTAVNGQGLVEFSRIPQVQNNTGLAVGAGIKAAGTMVNTALQLTAQNFDNRYALQVAKNSAPTHVSGSFGACTSWHFPNYCYVKITRPHFKKPDNYGHTEAVPVVATKQLSSLSGLTTCVNPDVSSIGTATMQELETIKSYLMSGVIL